MPQVFQKTATEVLDYTFDFSDRLTEDGGDTIDSAAITVETGISKDSEAISATAATVWVSGGTIWTTYKITCTATTVGGRTYVRTIWIDVVKEL